MITLRYGVSIYKVICNILEILLNSSPTINFMIPTYEEARERVLNYETRVAEAAKYIKEHLRDQPVFAITLGSGLGDLADEIENAQVIPYNKIPNFPTPTTKGHAGNLIIGELEGVPILGLQGRKHWYEVSDWPMRSGILEVAFAADVVASLGIGHCFLTNATGGANLEYKVGDLMVIQDHINFGIPSPIGGRKKRLSTLEGKTAKRFTDQSENYDPGLSKMLHRAAKDAEKDFRAHKGVLVAKETPEYESAAEVRMLRSWGADAMGMSVVPEDIALRTRGVKVFGFSLITNQTSEDGTNATSHEEVMATLNDPRVKNFASNTIKGFLRLYKTERGL